MIRICLIIPTLKLGGQERVMSILANNFAERQNVEVHLLLFTKADKAYQVSQNVVIHEPKFYFNPSLRLLHTAKTMFFIRETIKHIKPVVILSFGEKWNSLVLLSTILIKSKKYISDRRNPTLKLSFTQRVLRKCLYPFASGIISQTNIAKDIMLEKIKHSNITVIGNPIRQIKKHSVEKENIILNVGRFVTEKRQKLLIKLYSELGRFDWKLVFVGSGTLLDSTKEYAKHLDVDDYVTFIGETKDVDEYYLKSKVFAYTSISEGFPNVLGEALSAGLAVVSTRFIAGSDELIKDNYNGFLISENDNELYKAKLVFLMENPHVCNLFARNSETKLSKYNLDVICQKYFDFIINNQ